MFTNSAWLACLYLNFRLCAVYTLCNAYMCVCLVCTIIHIWVKRTQLLYMHAVYLTKESFNACVVRHPYLFYPPCYFCCCSVWINLTLQVNQYSCWALSLWPCHRLHLSILCSWNMFQLCTLISHCWTCQFTVPHNSIWLLHTGIHVSGFEFCECDRLLCYM